MIPASVELLLHIWRVAAVKDEIEFFLIRTVACVIKFVVFAEVGNRLAFAGFVCIQGTADSHRLLFGQSGYLVQSARLLGALVHEPLT